jgi:hypothetical protein
MLKNTEKRTFFHFSHQKERIIEKIIVFAALSCCETGNGEPQMNVNSDSFVPPLPVSQSD